MAKTSDLEESFAWQLKAGKLPAPVREHCPVKGRRWRVDFAWLTEKVAIEVEGGIWNGGRHTSGVGFTKDIEKYNALTLDGWRVIRVTGDMVKNGQALRYAELALTQQTGI